jgi:hypothetical protein
MGQADITVLHSLRRGELELSPSLEAESSLLGDNSKMACSEGDPLRVMPLTTAPELPPSSDGIMLLERLAMNSRSSKWRASVLSELDAEQKWVSPMGLHR